MLGNNKNASISSNIQQAINTVVTTDLTPYDVVSFDIYDTAVLRKTYEPRDVFLMVQEKLLLSHKARAFQAYANRREVIERKLIETVRAEDYGNEITLDEIYASLVHYYPEYTDHVDMLKQVELETELALTIQNPMMYRVYENAIKQGKKVIFASDIYLPQSHMAAVLKNAGYDSYDQLFVSCELSANKSSGSLFQHILKTLNLSPSKVVHFGDNDWSDREMAQRNGITGIKVPYAADLLEDHRYSPKDVERNIANSLFKGAIKNHLIAKTDHTPFDIGYEVLGPLVYYFTDWFATHARQQSIENIYFIAREGWYLQQVFDLIKEKRELPINSHYLLASRRSLLFPYIDSNLEEGFTKFLISETTQKLSDYLASIEISASDEELSLAGFSGTGEVINAKNNPHDYARLIKLLNLCKERILANADEEKKLYVKYMHSIGMMQNKPVAVVDSGWFGNGQKMLFRFLQDNGFKSSLHGFYLALHRMAKEKLTGDSIGHGFLFQFDTTEQNTELFIELAKVAEVLLSAPSESFKRFKEVDGALEPVYISENGANNLAPAIAQMQQGSLKFVQEQLAFDPEGQYMPDKALVKNAFLNFIEQPRQYEAEIFGALPYEANMLQGEEKPFIEANNSIKEVFKNPKKAVEAFNDSHWRGGYYQNTKSYPIRMLYQFASRYFYEKTPAYRLLRKIKKRIKP